MPAYNLQLTDEIERKLQASANVRGEDLRTIALEILEQGLHESAPAEDPNDLPYEVWHQRLDAMLKGLPRVDVIVDDSRASIYQGMGE